MPLKRSAGRTRILPPLPSRTPVSSLGQGGLNHHLTQELGGVLSLAQHALQGLGVRLVAVLLRGQRESEFDTGWRGPSR